MYTKDRYSARTDEKVTN